MTAARLDASLRAAVALHSPPSTAVFFDALEAADAAVRDADYNALLARTAPSPDVFASCVCGAELSIVTTEITLTAAEMDAAAELADQFGISDPDSPVCRDQVAAVVRAINAAWARGDQQYVADFRDTHTDCHEDNA